MAASEGWPALGPGEADNLQVGAGLEAPEKDNVGNLDMYFYEKLYLSLLLHGYKHLLFSSIAGLLWSLGLVMVIVVEMLLLGPLAAPTLMNPLVAVAAERFAGKFLAPEGVSMAELVVMLVIAQLVLFMLALWAYYTYRFSRYLYSAYLIARAARLEPKQLPALAGYLALTATWLVLAGVLTLQLTLGSILLVTGSLVYVAAIYASALLLKRAVGMGRRECRLGVYLLVSAGLLHIGSLVMGGVGLAGFAVQAVGLAHGVKRLSEALRYLYGSVDDEAEFMEQFLLSAPARLKT